MPTLTTDRFGNKFWFKRNKYHRLDGPAIEKTDGTTYWYQHGELHRVDGPAVIKPTGFEAWYKNGKKHRLDGPAVTTSFGGHGWWIDGNAYSKDQFTSKILSTGPRYLAKAYNQKRKAQLNATGKKTKKTKKSKVKSKR